MKSFLGFLKRFFYADFIFLRDLFALVKEVLLFLMKLPVSLKTVLSFLILHSFFKMYTYLQFLNSKLIVTHFFEPDINYSARQAEKKVYDDLGYSYDNLFKVQDLCDFQNVGIGFVKKFSQVIDFKIENLIFKDHSAVFF